MKLDEGAPSTRSHHRWHRYLGLRTSPVEVLAQAFAFSLLLQLATSSNALNSLAKPIASLVTGLVLVAAKPKATGKTTKRIMKLEQGALAHLSHHIWHRYVDLRSSPGKVHAQAVAFTLLLLLVTSSNAGYCGVGWTLRNGFCYNITSPMNWFGVQQACESLNGSIAAILNRSQESDIYEYLREQGIYGAWIGLNKLQNPAQWLWDSGEVVSYINWAKNEPNNQGGGEYCVVIWDPYSKWNDYQCNMQRRGVCKKSGSCGIGWTQRNGFCYNATSEMSWSNARQACISVGGSITDIRSSSQERDVVEYLIFLGIGRAWIGLNKADNQSQWRWDSGVDVTYSNWADGEPNNRDGNEYCAEIVVHRSTGWHDEHCNSNYHGLCKKTAPSSYSTTPLYSKTNEVSSSILSTHAGLASYSTTPLYSKTNEVSSSISSTNSGLASYSTTPLYSTTNKVSSSISETHSGGISPPGNTFQLIPVIVIPLSLLSTAVATAVGIFACRQRFCFQPRSQSTGNTPDTPPPQSDGVAQYANVDLSPAARIQCSLTSDVACYSSLVRSEDRIYASLAFTADAPQPSSNHSGFCNQTNVYSLPPSLSPSQHAAVSVSFAAVPFQCRGTDSSRPLDFVAQRGKKPTMATSLSEA